MQKTSVLHNESIFFLLITLFSYNLRKKIAIKKLQFLQFLFWKQTLSKHYKNTKFDKVASGRIKPVKHTHMNKIK